MYWLILSGILAAIVLFDLLFKILTKPVPALVMFTASSHFLFLYYFASTFPSQAILPFRIFTILLAVYFLLRFAFYSAKIKVKISTRLRIMMGGKRIFLVSAASLIFQIPAAILLITYNEKFFISTTYSTSDIIVSSVMTLLFMLIGIIKIFFTSRRLGLAKRILFFLFFWILPVSGITGIYFCRIVKKEFLYEVEKEELQNIRAESRICATRYPFLMLHGIGFRDYKLVNYWGRIPGILKKNGAIVAYGKQQAWGTIEKNAEEIKNQLIQFLDETGSEKVNIIAHSKGGLDARYMISSLGMSDKVASLTTISTPHRGSELIDVLSKMKDSRYHKITNRINKIFRKLGDTNPDAYTASKQLQPQYLIEFNKANPDIPGVYYQSYATEMKNPASHSLLSITQAIMKLKAGNNDGLVTIESAKWGTFKGTIKSSQNRGISHADQIDLMHQDYDGFDIAEEYVKIVSELKEMGL